MLPTFIFFFAIVFTWAYLINYLNDLMSQLFNLGLYLRHGSYNKKDPREDKIERRVNYTLFLITCLLWSWLFYLLH